MIKTSSFQCKKHGFHLWSGNYDPACPQHDQKKKKVKIDLGEERTPELDLSLENQVGF